MVYSDFKDLARKLSFRYSFEIKSIHEKGLFDIHHILGWDNENERLAEELHKPIATKTKKKEKYILYLKRILRVLIYLICN